MNRPPLVRRIMRGRRLTEPVDLPADPGTLAVRGRLASVSVGASAAAGAWVGFAIGLVLGALLGAVVAWFSGAILDWQRDLAFTFGVTRRLLPFGDQQALLRDIEARWWLVIPGIAVVVGIVAAMVGALLGGILAAAYNRSPKHALVVVELPSDVPTADPQPAAGFEPQTESPVPGGASAAIREGAELPGETNRLTRERNTTL